MSTPSLVMIPCGYKGGSPKGKLYSVLPTDGSGDFDSTRASAATRVNSEGLIELVSSNVPRLNHPLIDGVVQGCPSLLLEPQRININTFSDPTDAQKGSTSYASVTYQDDFNWGLGNVINNAIVFGDNSTTRYAYYNSTVVSGTEYTLSFFIKMDDNSVPIPATDFLLILAGTGIASGHTIDNYGNNVYRVSVSETAGASNTANGVLKVASHSAKTFKITGFQIEAGSYATSYIPTSGATATRLADVVNRTGISSIIGQTEGTIVINTTNFLSSGSRTLALLYASGASYYQIYLTALNEVRIDVSGVFLFLGGTLVSGTQSKIAFAYKSGDFALYIDGVQIATSVSATIPASLNDLYVGNSLGGEQVGDIGSFSLYDTRLPNAELITLTT